MQTIWLMQGDGIDGPLWYSDTAEGEWTDDRSEAKIFATEEEAHEFGFNCLDGSECIPCGPVPYVLEMQI